MTHALDGDVARLTLTGELTGFARRPLMRVLTDLLLQVQSLHRVELDLRGVTFMNSAGMAVLVQALRMTSPRAIELVARASPVGGDPAAAAQRALASVHLGRSPRRRRGPERDPGVPRPVSPSAGGRRLLA